MTKKIIFISNYASFFVSHRLPIALEAKKRGWEVFLFHGSSNNKNEFKNIDILHKNKILTKKFYFTRSGINLFNEIFGFLQLIIHVRRVKPDIIHCISLKGILYGGLTAKLLSIKSLVLAVSGMGYFFTGKKNITKSSFQLFFHLILKYILTHNNKCVITQNQIDRDFFLGKYDLEEKNIDLIKGSGVNIEHFNQSYNLDKNVYVTLISRMLYDKGVKEFIDAAKYIYKKNHEIKFLLVGGVDAENPAFIPQKQLEKISNEKNIIWLGEREDIAQILGKTRIFCLPSYREGMPKTNLEAAAAGVPIITSDTIGCNESIIENKTGKLIEIRNVEALSNAILELYNDKEKLLYYSKNAKKLAKENYSIESVVSQTFALYKKITN